MEKLLILNPGSTSTKVAVFEDETPLFTESISHSVEELAGFDKMVDQYEFRKNIVMECLKAHDIDIKSLSAIVARGGLLAPIETGAYRVNEDMIWQLKNKPRQEHASNLGALIADSIAKELDIPAFIYDGVTADEMLDMYRITGVTHIRRQSQGHNLNTRAAAIRYAREQGKKYGDITAITVHLGGGITVNLHNNGKIEDFISDDEGPFSPERSGGLPMFFTIDWCFNGASKGEIVKECRRKGGLMAHLGTTDCKEVEKRIAEGDEHAKLIYDAMILNIAKNVAKLTPDVNGKLDAIIITGGIAYSDYIIDGLRKRLDWIAPIVVYPGEDEMLSLALGGLRVMRGEEQPKDYHKVIELN